MLNTILCILIGLSIVKTILDVCKLIYDSYIVPKLEKILVNRVRKFAIKNFERIDGDDILTPTKGYRNNRCHWNSYHKMIEQPFRYKMYAVLCIDSGSTVVHFINKDIITGKYLDETLGVMGSIYYSYYIIGECEFTTAKYGIYSTNMDDKLCELKEWIIKKMFKYKFVADRYIGLQNRHGFI